MKNVLNLFRSRKVNVYLTRDFRLSILDPVNMSGSSSIFDPRAQYEKINIANCNVTTWSWVNLVNPTRLGIRS